MSKQKNKESGSSKVEQNVPKVIEPLESPVGEEDDLLPEGKLVCALTGEQRTATPQEETLQSFVEQLHREYLIAIEDMGRDVRIHCQTVDPRTGKPRTRSRTASLVVYESGRPHEVENIIRIAVIASPGTKPEDKAIAVLEEMLAGLSEDRVQVFGLWTNGINLAFRMRTYNSRTGEPEFTELTDFPAPDETLDDLEKAERRPLRVATADSLLRTFKRCHDYLYGNQSMRGDRAFWQLLYLIFCKILDEQQSSRRFFVGATEANTDKGRRQIAIRIKDLFDQVRNREYRDVFDGSERLELNERALAYVAGELSRYSLLSTDTDAKGLAYEAITSSTLKRERGQFFTPRNVIRMMIEMVDPQPDKLILDPACGSGGFLVVALAHYRRRLLMQIGANPDAPVPSELRRIDRALRKYAKSCLFGTDVDPDLRKAARMNMVMNNDGHGNILCFNSLEFGVAGREAKEMTSFEKLRVGHDKFDYVFTNPPFGSKIPVSDSAVLDAFDLGHSWSRSSGVWQRGSVLKKVAPEILFIEACGKFLKPGSGVMAIVLPNGILGNPGEQMEGVRWWMTHYMELIASIDLPGETFLPQVSVQASCVFLRRRNPDELMLSGPGGPDQRPVFMAIAQDVGHGRRGEPRYRRKPDGSEDLRVVEIVERWENANGLGERMRRSEMRVLADDLPWISQQFRRFVAGESFEEA
ncbi:MAG: HsdM family class I SAM-dependent methyltransferase [Pyrinomonadaceae bacterium]